MPTGLQIFADNSTEVLVDTSTLVPRLALDIGEVTASGGVSIPAINEGAIPIVVVTPSGSQQVPPQIAINGPTITWSKVGGYNMRAELTVNLM
jgi:hypothetical protein